MKPSRDQVWNDQLVPKFFRSLWLRLSIKLFQSGIYNFDRFISNKMNYRQCQDSYLSICVLNALNESIREALEMWFLYWYHFEAYMHTLCSITKYYKTFDINLICHFGLLLWTGIWKTAWYSFQLYGLCKVLQRTRRANW